jgi:hypothetical protein
MRIRFLLIGLGGQAAMRRDRPPAGPHRASGIKRSDRGKGK